MVHATSQEGSGDFDRGHTALEELLTSVVKSMAHTDALKPKRSDGLVMDITVDGIRVVVSRPAPPTEKVRLSPREREIVRLVASGLPNKSIASVLDISPWTVSNHLRRVFVKLGVASRAEMVAVALDRRLVAWRRKPKAGDSPT